MQRRERRPRNGSNEASPIVRAIIAIGRLSGWRRALGMAGRAAFRVDSDMPVQTTIATDWAHAASIEKRTRSFVDFQGDVTVADLALAVREGYAHVELAKVCEHRQKNFAAALQWTQSAIEIVTAPTYPEYERQIVLPELEHRLARLERKLATNH